MMVVVDASVIIKIITEERGSDAAAARVMLADERIAPDWIRLEVASGLSKKVRMAGLPIEQARASLSAMDFFLTELADTNALVDRAFALSVLMEHALYDCLYLALAEARGCILLTADAKFVAATVRNNLSRHVELLS